MKKIFLTTIALLSMASATIFGMYGPDSDWITFLTDGNRFRARADQLGFTLGNDTIKGTFGFDNNTGFGGTYGGLLVDNDGTHYSFVPSISMGLAYTSSLISVGVGYNATVGSHVEKFNGKTEPKTVNKSAHTPVLVLNAMDNAFRMAIPIQVFVDNDNTGGTKMTTTVVSFDAQFRYYTGLDALPQIRLYLRYGGGNFKFGDISEKIGESFGFDFRLYFGSMVEEVALQPIIKLAYNGALGKYHKNTRVEAVKIMNGYTVDNLQFAKSAWDLNLVAGLGLTANSDIVSLYLEPQLGLQVTRKAPSSTQTPGAAPAPVAIASDSYGLAYNVYAEIYITPLKNLE
ncbi:cell surface protein [uncultured Brachyspira sp.]|uniref:cell surface protein n=1 Tax=uncultured Brachyspira sp. TaxID=221953 RepID=UPI00259032D1|nr:cell surface protein [uncultured Brachyspira sp.]